MVDCRFSRSMFWRNDGGLVMAEYISPTGFVDSGGTWTGEQYVYDGDLHSGATCLVPPLAWSNYIELTTSPIYCSKVKFHAYYGNGISKIDVDVYYDGAWHDVFEGAFISMVWVEKSIGSTQYVTKMRCRFYCISPHGMSAALTEVMFYKTVGVPLITTSAATLVEDETATLNGNMTNNGSEAPTIRGFEYKEGTAGAVQYAYDSGYFSVGAFSKAITGLDSTKKYYFRAYATNTSGSGYGEWLSFGVDVDAPTVTSSAATLVDHEKATLGGNITATGGQDCNERGFEYKVGVGGDVSEVKETGEFGVGAYTLLLEDINANIEYYFRAYAKNDADTAYGGWLSFTTDYTTPDVITHNATDELETQVTGNGQIVKTGGHDCDERGFEYGLTKAPTWKENEVAGSYGVGFFDLDITGLSANTEYWYRAYAKYCI